MPLDLVVVCPLEDGLAGELGAIVRDYAGRFPIDADQSVQFPCNSGPRDAGVSNQAKVFTAAIVIDCKDAEFTARPKGV